MSTKNKILIVDTMALLFRGFYATAVSGNYMQNRAGQYTNGIYQYLRYFTDAMQRIRPTHVVCAMDMGKHTFRNELFADYKANRSDPPQELIPQFALIKDVMESLHIPVIGIEGYEADDVMGTIAKQVSSSDVHAYILTGDGDTLQLVDEHIRVVLMKKGIGNYEIVSKDTLPTLKEIDHAYQVVEIKALMGDAADNIPGCPGIGPKIARQLIGQYENVDGLYEHIDQLKGKRKEKLIENRDLVYLSRDLATIRTDIDLDCVMDAYTFELPQSFPVLEELELDRLIPPLQTLRAEWLESQRKVPLSE